MRGEKPQGRAHRALLRSVVVPHLRPGITLPPTRLIGKLLGVCQQEAHRHITRVLREDGFVTEVHAHDRLKRIHVVGRLLSPISSLSPSNAGSQRVVTPVYEGSDTRIEVGP